METINLEPERQNQNLESQEQNLLSWCQIRDMTMDEHGAGRQVTRS